MSNDRYERIRAALAMGPTPGPRRAVEQSVIGPQDLRILSANVTFSVGINGSHSVLIEEAIANATLAAACDPDTIRALLAERDQLAAALEAAQEEVDALAKDAAKYRWGINNARWIRSEQEAYVAIPVAPDADLSCVAMRDAAIDAALAKETSND